MDIFINPKIIKVDRNRGHKVTYYLYNEEGGDISRALPSNVKTNSNTVCFAALIRELKGDTRINRIMYMGKFTDKDALDETERIYWMRLCKENNFLPEYADESWAADGRWVLKLNDRDLNPSLLYIYLTCFRVMQEDPGFVRVMLFLVPCYRMDYCAAWCLASLLTITNSWHNIIEIGRSYGSSPSENVNKMLVPIKYAIGLKRYMKDPKSHDQRGLRDKDSHPFSVFVKIQAMCSVSGNINVPAGNLMDPNVVKALNSENDKEALKNLKEWNPKVTS